MIYDLIFKTSALKDWYKLDNSIKKIFEKKLAERLLNPKISTSKLRGSDNLYKIKLKKLGYRLVYQVSDNRLIVTVIAIGKREKNEVYIKALNHSK